MEFEMAGMAQRNQVRFRVFAALVPHDQMMVLQVFLGSTGDAECQAH
jgi:hypothetical protein